MALLQPENHLKFRGFFRLQVTNAAGEVVRDSGIFPNLITNQGLDFIGTGKAPGASVSSYFTLNCCIGTGNATPAFTDTTLQAGLSAIVNNGFVAASNTSYNPGPPAYWQGQWSYQFAAGTATGNIAEIGVGPPQASGATGATMLVFSRALVVDGGGAPTVIPVLASEALTVTYILQVYFNTTQTSYTMSLSGTPYSGVWSMAKVGTVPPLGYPIGGTENQDIAYGYNGSIGAITGLPSGTATDYAVAAITAYSLGTYYSTRTYSWDINHGNISGGISAMSFQENNSAGSFQMSVSPAIPKTNVYNMSIVNNTSWARYP
jgi:hypothetical protein